MGMSLNTTQAYKLGEYGELLVKRTIERRGYLVYGCETKDVAHPLDTFIVKRTDWSRLFLLEVKTKKYRDAYPDTGINTRHYHSYTGLIETTGMRFLLAFVDSKLKAIYMGELGLNPEQGEHINAGYTIATAYGNQSYPFPHGRQTYFPLGKLLPAYKEDTGFKLLRKLTEQEISKIGSLSK
jgi:hypothetical protein